MPPLHSDKSASSTAVADGALSQSQQSQQQRRQVSPAATAAAAQSEGARVQLSSDIPPGVEPVVQNVVATVNLCLKLDLKNIAMRARNAEYNPKRFAAVIMRIRDPKTTALIFSTGKLVITGARSEEDARLSARKFAKIVRKLGYDEVKFADFGLHNLVASADARFPVRLEALGHAHANYAHYEPELFPGLVYRMLDPKLALLIFVSGKVVITGAKSRDDLYDAFNKIYPVLLQFRKADARTGGHDAAAVGGAATASGGSGDGGSTAQ